MPTSRQPSGGLLATRSGNCLVTPRWRSRDRCSIGLATRCCTRPSCRVLARIVWYRWSVAGALAAWVEVCEKAWNTYILNMSPSVASMFEDLGVTTLGDGRAMLETVVHAARRMHSSRVAAPFGMMSLADVALQACEAYCARSVFGKAATKENPRWRGAAAGMEWFLRRVPANRRALAKFSKSVRLKQYRQRRGAPDACEDPHGAAVVAQAWVSSERPHCAPTVPQ